MHNPEWLQYVSSSLMVVTVSSSVLVAFIANRQGDGKDFWYRFVGIHFVAALYVLLTSMPLIVTFLNAVRNPRNSDLILQPIDMFIITIGVAIFNYLIYKYMRIASGAENKMRVDSQLEKPKEG